jgi:hypothetical protein
MQLKVSKFSQSFQIIESEKEEVDVVRNTTLLTGGNRKFIVLNVPMLRPFVLLVQVGWRPSTVLGIKYCNVEERVMFGCAVEVRN